MNNGMVGNFELPSLVNPPAPYKAPALYGAVYVPKQGRLSLFRERIKIVRRGFGHHYWSHDGKDVCPVHKMGDKWVVSTRD